MTIETDQAAGWTGRWIENAMKHAGINQRELAERAGMSRTFVCRLLNSRSAARLDTIIKILAACGLEIDELRVKSVN